MFTVCSPTLLGLLRSDAVVPKEVVRKDDELIVLSVMSSGRTWDDNKVSWNMSDCSRKLFVANEGSSKAILDSRLAVSSGRNEMDSFTLGSERSDVSRPGLQSVRIGCDHPVRSRECPNEIPRHLMTGVESLVEESVLLAASKRRHSSTGRS